MVFRHHIFHGKFDICPRTRTFTITALWWRRLGTCEFLMFSIERHRIKPFNILKLMPKHPEVCVPEPRTGQCSWCTSVYLMMGLGNSCPRRSKHTWIINYWKQQGTSCKHHASSHEHIVFFKHSYIYIYINIIAYHKYHLFFEPPAKKPGDFRHFSSHARDSGSGAQISLLKSNGGVFFPHLSGEGC